VFVTFEGPEGSGKTVQAQLLADYLEREHKLDVLLTREPGGTRIGDLIRGIFLSPENQDMSPKTELLLVMAARAQHVAELIKPALERGKIVICTRFIDATLAYQGYGRGLSESMINELNEFVSEGVKPDITFILDVDLVEGLRRARKKSRLESPEGDRIEQLDLSFHQRVKEGYLSIARREPQRIKVIPPGSKREVHEQVRETVLDMLQKRGVI